MQFTFSFYSSLLLAFFLHTLVYSILSFVRFRRQQLESSRWLGWFLLTAAAYIAPWMLGFAGWYDNQPYRDLLFYLPLQHLFLIGPFIFFYVQSLVNPAFRLERRLRWHFLPGLLYASWCAVVAVYDRVIAHNYYFLWQQEDPDFDTWYQIAGFVSMVAYFSAAYVYYHKYKKSIVEVISNAADFQFSWVRNFLLAFLFILLANLVLAFFSALYDLEYAYTWWYFFSFALSCYYIAIAGYSNSVVARVFFKTELFADHRQVLFPTDKTAISTAGAPGNFIEMADEPARAAVAEEPLDAWKTRVEQLLAMQALYREPELTLLDVAKKLDTNVSQLSRVINRGFGLNFNDLINRYRVEAMIAALKNRRYESHTLLSIAFDCGFNSKTTFNRAFKKHTGLSPQEYIRQQL